MVRDALLWNDTRSAQAARDLTEELGGPQAWVRRTGSVPVPSFTVTKVRWLAEHEPEQRRAGRTTCVLPHDWLTAQILKQGNGFERYTTDRGDASGTGYFSSVDDAYLPDLWSSRSAAAFGVPAVLGPHEAGGTHRRRHGRRPRDGRQRRAPRSGLGLRPGDVVVSLGTSGPVFADADQPVADPSGAASPAFAERDRRAPAPDVHPQRRPGADRRGRSCSAPTWPGSTGWPSPPRPAPAG